MGIFDFVRAGVERMSIARPDAHKSRVVYKHPDQTFALYSQLTVDSDEVCLFFKDGRYVGALGPGRHTLQTQNIPFLNSLVDHFTKGNVFISELFFVTTRPVYNQPFGDSIGSMRDPELDLRVTPRAFGTFSYRVVDPIRFILGFLGQTGVSEPDEALRWVCDQLFMGLRVTLTEMIREAKITFMDLGMAGPEVARSVVANCPALTEIGVQVLEVARLSINLSAEDQARVDQMQDQIVQAKLDARKARIAISQAEAEAQQRQFRLDQDFLNRARYVQHLDMNRYQQYAASEAMIGAGQGMAEPGGAGQFAAGGAALGLGFGMAGAIMQPRTGGPVGLPMGAGWGPGVTGPATAEGFSQGSTQGPVAAPAGHSSSASAGGGASSGAPPAQFIHGAASAAGSAPARGAPSGTEPSPSRDGTFYCPECGSPTSRTGKFCVECGARLRPAV